MTTRGLALGPAADYGCGGMRRALRISILLLALSPAFSGCETEPPAKSALGYTDNAKNAYDKAMETFNAHQWVEAQAALREVKRKYGYSKYARLAELRIADADFEQEKYSDAIRGYKEFIHAHRADEDVAYARSKIAEATVAQIPEGMFLAASEERDQAAVVDAYREVRSFLADYPNAKQSAHMREVEAQILARLVRHELYVARFYLARGNYDAAVSRIQYALKTYPELGATEAGATGEDTSLEADALLLLGETFLRMHKWDDARQAFQEVLRKHGRSMAAGQARNYLDHLHERGA
ncbi:MAG: outer membrane protein assembly factor BamD [Polyangiaceae bacterium]|nr:outer membrane protein assembly factor BamD [Polyangiaceae bacterium]